MPLWGSRALRSFWCFLLTDTQSMQAPQKPSHHLECDTVPFACCWKSFTRFKKTRPHLLSFSSVVFESQAKRSTQNISHCFSIIQLSGMSVWWLVQINTVPLLRTLSGAVHSAVRGGFFCFDGVIESHHVTCTCHGRNHVWGSDIYVFSVLSPKDESCVVLTDMGLLCDGRV